MLSPTHPYADTTSNIILKRDIEEGVGDWVALIAARLDPDNKNHADDNEPKIMSQLPSNLFADKVHPGSAN